MSSNMRANETKKTPNDWFSAQSAKRRAQQTSEPRERSMRLSPSVESAELAVPPSAFDEMSRQTAAACASAAESSSAYLSRSSRFQKPFA
eukprot:5416506-Pleurochrysis_carterae.AAC.1